MDNEEKITVDNCREISIRFTKENDLGDCGKSGAWKTVHFYCLQNGMKNMKRSGIEQVIYFIDNLVKHKKPPKGQKDKRSVATDDAQ